MRIKPPIAGLIVLALAPQAPCAEPAQGTAEAGTETPEESPAYVDQILDERPREEVGAEIEEELGPLDEGRRSLSTEYRMTFKDNSQSGSATEHGAELFWDRETIDYGFLSLDASVRGIAGEREQQSSFGERVRLRQTQFALTNDVVMDNESGDLLSLTNPLISPSYRFHLPSSHLRGLQTRLYGEDGELSFAAGQIGNLEGTFTQTFSRFGGSLWGLGYTRPFLDSWTVGAQSWQVTDLPDMRNHTSIAGLLQYEAPDLSQRYQLHSLYDTTGNWGLWMDGDNFLGQWRHRYGLFRFQPELMWTDVPVVNDLQGLYWRADERTLRRSLSAGLDLSDTNVEAFEDRAGRISLTSYLSGHWRLLNKTAAGGTLNAGLVRAGAGLPSAPSEFYRMTGNVSREFSLGVSRVQSSVGRVEGDNASSWEYLAIWDHEWAAPRDYRLSQSLSWDRLEEEDDLTTRVLAALSADLEVSSELHLNSSAVYVKTIGESSGQGQDINLTLGLVWEPIPNWQLTLLGLWNQSATEPSMGEETSVRDMRVFFTLRRAIATGSPVLTYGGLPGQVGSGRVIGRVFFDENRDGLYNASEKGAKGLVVYMDGRFPRDTDDRGVFEFWPVSTGDHNLSLGLENVPLPWGLEDEAAKPLKVQGTGGRRDRLPAGQDERVTDIARLPPRTPSRGTGCRSPNDLDYFGCATTRMYGFFAVHPCGNFCLASSSETAGTMITSSPCFQFTGVATLCRAVNCTESSSRRTSSKFRPVLMG
jgi:hypothetical protein